MKHKAIIIDDEENAITGLSLLIEHASIPLEIVGSATNVIDGLKLYKLKQPDIVFLDIEMPEATGFDFLQLAEKGNGYFIFTTAHEQYALRAIKEHIDDYLLKPIGAEDLKQSINRAFSFIKARGQSLNEVPNHQKISITTGNGTIFKELKEIIYIKAQNRYSEIFCLDGASFLVCKNLGEYEDELLDRKFFRVHKSYLVNCFHVQKINNIDGGFIQLTGGNEVEISRRKKAEFMDIIKG
jgi:two-component system, LytTR family, response regulator